MSKERRWHAWLILGAVCLLSCGCVDTVRDGVTAGVSNGVAGLIESYFAWLADLASGSA